MPRTRVFVDTNVILEAFRIGCWTAICRHYAIETVEKCIEESLTGDPRDPRRIEVDGGILIAGLAARHSVRKRELACLVLDHPHCQGLDDGELHLLAWLHAHERPSNTLVLISTADKAAIVATTRLGWIDSLTSLEQLARGSGLPQRQIEDFLRHYRSGWLDEIRVKIRLGIIP